MELVRSTKMVSVLLPLLEPMSFQYDEFEKLYQKVSSKYSNFEFLLLDKSKKNYSVISAESVFQKIPFLRYYSFSERSSPENIISAGLDRTIGEIVVVFTLKYDPTDLVLGLIDQASTGKILMGVPNRASIGWTDFINRTCFYFIARRIFAIEMIPHTSFFIVLNRKAISQLNLYKDKYKFFRHLLTAQKELITVFDYIPVNRNFKFKRGLYNSLVFATDIIISNSTIPLKIISLLGLVFFCTNIYALFSNGAFDKQHLMFSFFCLAFSIFAEYFILLISEVKSHPTYTINEYKESVNNNIHLVELNVSKDT